MKPFEVTRAVEWEDCDANRRLRPSSLLVYFQDAAIGQISSVGYPFSYTSARNAFWVIAKQRIEILRMPCFGETVTVQTYPGETMKYLFPRYYEVMDSSGKTIARGTAIWTLINGDTRKFVEPSSIGLFLEGMSKGDELSASFSTLAEGATEEADVRASWSLCDSNGHMNNVKYLDAAEDAIPGDYLRFHECRLIEVSYRKEVHWNETIRLSYGEENNVWTFACPAFFLRLSYAEKPSPNASLSLN